jgi:N-methylhydantoinase A/oxoprolinase/acetone carboxylase beta subunit
MSDWPLQIKKQKTMGRLQVAIDRGGTFTDVVARTSDGRISTMKLLSEDPEKYPDAPTEAIRRLLQQVFYYACVCVSKEVRAVLP